MIREDLRNIAIIAHVDHGKTTLVDEMLKQGGAFRENQAVADRVMDSGDLERERGITILAKNTSAVWNGVKINIVDTPGHADFGGEVERVLKMVNGVVLLVDAAEGPMPQTRFVLQKALELGHRVIVVVNKVDKPDARPYEVVDECLELLLDLDASEEQLDSPIIFCSGRNGTAGVSPDNLGSDLSVLFEKILEQIPAPEGDIEGPAQVLVSSIDYNDFVGRIAIGRVERGVLRQNQDVMVCDWHNSIQPYRGKITAIYQIEGLKRVPCEEAKMGDIICFSGITDITIGNTICDLADVSPLPFVKISEPTVEMTFSVNNSPFAGREGKFVTSRQLRDRLFKELLKDVSLRVEETDSSDSFRVCGRGEMHLSILIETMRREGFEFQVSTPHVLFQTDENGTKLEPIERLLVDVPEEYMGSVMEKMGARKGELVHMAPSGSRMRIEFLVPSRGLFGYKSEFLTDTRGEGIMNAVFDGYQPYKGEIDRRTVGSLIAFETGESITYGLYNAQERGTLFIGPGVPVYEGMIVGCSPKSEDLAVNVCKKKHVSNMRASGSDEALRLVPYRRMSLEECLEFLGEDELLEVTPKNLRLRKRILNNSDRMKNIFKGK
ncbi:translational GTPase TypA [Phocea massiliensis]|uniref:Large ribosomal subunit assembly factor BipA n=1 Tax=uncultured Anaerotruncus sp. TaxID=905011 RepID=A0A6N2UWH4_9FIRM|nr:translational GTPase TypA [Merdimmobilis hominis]MCD4836901.1 translational GTPase TypA [Merdimmobilis hominis]